MHKPVLNGLVHFLFVKKLQKFGTNLNCFGKRTGDQKNFVALQRICCRSRNLLRQIRLVISEDRLDRIIIRRERGEIFFCQIAAWETKAKIFSKKTLKIRERIADCRNCGSFVGAIHNDRRRYGNDFKFCGDFRLLQAIANLILRECIATS